MSDQLHTPRVGKDIRTHIDEESVSGGVKNILPLRKVELRIFGCPARSLFAGPTGLSRVGVSVRTRSPERHIVLREVSDSDDSEREDYAGRAVNFEPARNAASRCFGLSPVIRILLTFWRRNYFFNFSTLCI